VKDGHGISKWKRVQVKLKDHIKVPNFPPGLEFCDDYMRGYLSKIKVDCFPEDLPCGYI